MAVSKNTRSSKVPAAKPVTTGISVSLFPQRLRVELDAVHMAMDEADSLVHVANVALRHQSCNIDGDVAVLLDTVYDKLKEGRDRLMNAFDVLQGVSNV